MNILLIFLISAFSCFGQAFTFNDIAFLNSASQNNPADNKVVTLASPLVLDVGGNYFFTNIIVKSFGYIKINNSTIQYQNPTRWTCIICSNLTMEANATFSPNYFNNNGTIYQGNPITATAPDSYPLSYLYPDGNNSSGFGGGAANSPYPFGYPSLFGGGGGKGYGPDAEFGIGSADTTRGGNGGLGYSGDGLNYYIPGGGGGTPGSDDGPPNAGGDAGNYFIVGSIFGSYGAGGGGGGQGYSGGLVYLKVLSTINFSTGSSFNFNGQDGGNGGRGGDSAILPNGLPSGVISYGGCGGGGGGAGDGGVLILRYYSIANNNATYNFKAGNPGNPGAGGYGQSGIPAIIPNGIPGNSGLPANDGMISLIKMK